MKKSSDSPVHILRIVSCDALPLANESATSRLNRAFVFLTWSLISESSGDTMITILCRCNAGNRMARIASSCPARKFGSPNCSRSVSMGAGGVNSASRRGVGAC
eukprot:3493241-Rhodomonas_salina.1